LLIDKEKIQKAKEKLGDQNAFEMAKVFKLQEFDEKNLKSLCPIHQENTPSFVYNPKNYTFHCFGACSRSYDIIDAYMYSGLTYLEAVQELFEIANIKYSFGEYKVRTKYQYKYPKEVICNNKEKIYEYLALRKISKETIDYADIREDEHGNIVFNFYDENDTLTMIKYRPSHKIEKGENKMWCQKDADTTPLLFNMNRINVNNPLLICEGEIDCLSAIESGYLNAVSVPLGAGNYGWIETNWEWLQQFDSIIIASDNDDAGLKMQKEVIFRLGSWRTKIVDVPQYYIKDDKRTAIKDLNEVLYYFGKEKLLEIILNAKDSPVESVIDFSDIKEVDLDEIDGIYIGLDEIDRELMRLFYGTFTILTGVNGAGKSSLLSQLICESLDQGKDAWLYSKELPNYMSKNWINYILAGRRHIKEYTGFNNSVYYRVTNEAKALIDKHYKGRLYIYKDGWGNTLDDIKQSMEDSARKFGSKLFIVDNLTAVNLKNNDENKWDKQAEFVSYLIDFAQKFHVVVILVIHPKKIETMRRLTKVDVQGSGSMLDLAHRALSLYRVTASDKKGTKNNKGNGWFKEPIPYDVLVDVLKDRLRGREGLTCGLYYDIPSRRFFTNPKEFDRQYSWDTNKYTDKLPYPIKDETYEVFGNG
jgi:archaellum biogenesis ATPase FlaH